MASTKVDWNYWRTIFVRGNDTLTYRVLAEYDGAPAYQSLKNRGSREKWPEQRDRYRETVGTEAALMPEAQEIVAATRKLIDSAEMLTRHSAIGKAAIAIAARGMREINPRRLKSGEIIALARFGIEIERLTEGLATQRQEINVTQLTDAELDALEAELRSSV